MKYLALALIWVLFTLGAFLAGLLIPFLIFSKRASKTFHNLNRACASMYFGFDGDETISKGCGRRRCGVCNLLCRALEVLEKDHCAKEAQE